MHSTVPSMDQFHFFSTLVTQNVFHILLIIQVNMLIAFKLFKFACFYLRVSWAAYHECRRGGNLLG